MNGRNARIGGLHLPVVPLGAVAISDLVSLIACWLAWLESGGGRRITLCQPIVATFGPSLAVPTTRPRGGCYGVRLLSGH